MNYSVDFTVPTPDKTIKVAAMIHESDENKRWREKKKANAFDSELRRNMFS